jgi:S-adenosylmethionine-dependent methyltransferase
MGSFEEVETDWAARLGTLRNVVRQHVIGSQLAEHLSGIGTVLDVGCGQGTQALRLAVNGFVVTGVDPSTELLAVMQQDSTALGCAMEALIGEVADLDELLRDRQFDLVCAHGLLMYLPDPRSALATLAARTKTGGLLSVTFRNRDALAYRPGVRGQWREARSAFDKSTYVNELGAHASAHRLSEVLDWCNEVGLELQQWYGVRVLSDGLPADALPDQATLDDCLVTEVEAGRRDPYRWFGSQIHVLARRR